MKRTRVARLALLLVIAGGFGLMIWQLLASAPESKRARPEAPTPLVDVVDSLPRDYPLSLHASGTLGSALELEVRPQVGGRIERLHPDFEPGGRIPAGETIIAIEQADYRLALAAAEADVAKARAAIAIEDGRRVVAREELDILQGSVEIDQASRELALRKPQLQQVRAELQAAQNRLQQAQLDLQRTALTLPHDVIVIERSRVAGEVVAARELVGRVARADEFWLELRVQPAVLTRIRARDAQTPGSRVTVHDKGSRFPGEVVRIRPQLASGSRLAGVIVAIPTDRVAPGRLLLGSYLEAEIDAGRLERQIRVPRRALRGNQRVWVVDAEGILRVRAAALNWESDQQVFLDPATLQSGDRVVISRVTGMVPGAEVRSRLIDPDTGLAVNPPAAQAQDG
jgi:RND family efflux transporter MFP subunit